LNRHGNSLTKEEMESCQLKDSSYSLMQKSILMLSKQKDLKIAFLMNSWKLFKLITEYFLELPPKFQKKNLLITSWIFHQLLTMIAISKPSWNMLLVFKIKINYLKDKIKMINLIKKKNKLTIERIMSQNQ
jgi:hypothetical protein